MVCVWIREEVTRCFVSPPLACRLTARKGPIPTSTWQSHLFSEDVFVDGPGAAAGQQTTFSRGWPHLDYTRHVVKRPVAIQFDTVPVGGRRKMPTWPTAAASPSRMRQPTCAALNVWTARSGITMLPWREARWEAWTPNNLGPTAQDPHYRPKNHDLDSGTPYDQERGCDLRRRLPLSHHLRVVRRLVTARSFVAAPRACNALQSSVTASSVVRYLKLERR